jgi:hypothetical protein
VRTDAYDLDAAFLIRLADDRHNFRRTDIESNNHVSVRAL